MALLCSKDIQFQGEGSPKITVFGDPAEGGVQGEGEILLVRIKSSQFCYLGAHQTRQLLGVV